jgi:DNA-binding response OmpR family regulator
MQEWMSPSQRRTVLIVDDDPGVTVSFARMLALEGYDVRTALDAKTALREIDTSRPDAILLDLRLPVVDGLAFLRQLRARKDYRETPIAVITGDYFVDDSVTNALRELGAPVHLKPLWLDDLLAITKRLLDEPSSDQSIATRRLKLLLVDDCAAERTFYEAALATEFNILTAARGEEGVTVATRTHPDAIVLDIMMPGIDGWETCTRIKSQPSTADIPVILLTGTDARDLSQHALAVGASVLLRKPCAPDQLRATVHAVVPKN